MSFTSPKFPLKIGGLGLPIDPDETDQAIIDGQIEERADNVNFPDPGFQSLTNTSINDIRDLIKFHVKNILLCCPEERLWNPGFGVCIRKYLFDQMQDDKIIRNGNPGDPNSVITKQQIIHEIHQQFREFAPHIIITRMRIQLQPDTNTMRIAMGYRVDLIISPTTQSAVEAQAQTAALNQKLDEILDMIVDDQGISFTETPGSDDVIKGVTSSSTGFSGNSWEYFDSDGDGVIDSIRPAGGSGAVYEVEFGSKQVDFL